jgi:hypothetical protein
MRTLSQQGLMAQFDGIERSRGTMNAAEVWVDEQFQTTEREKTRLCCPSISRVRTSTIVVASAS